MRYLFVTMLVGCGSHVVVVPPCDDAGPVLADDAGFVSSSCEPDIYEPDDSEPYWIVISEQRLAVALPGTWHGDDALDRVKITVPREVATQPARHFTVHADGAASIDTTVRCVTGHVVDCADELPDPQACRSHADGPDLTITTSCSFGAAVLELDAAPAPNADCQRDIRVEVSP